MQPLARLPLFFDLKAKRAVVAGGSAPAAWKVELLAAAGATVDVYAEDASEELLAVINDAPDGVIRWSSRVWVEEDLLAAAIAIGACEDDAQAALFAAAARAAGTPVNVIDKPAFCDFAFGAIVNRSPLVVGISTDGAAPVFAQAIRAKIEAMLPPRFSAWCRAAAEWRTPLKALALSFAQRRQFWRRFTEAALSSPNKPPPAFDDLLAAARAEEADRGAVTLVGAGPGDPELLTLRAVRALQSADVILFDDLVSAEVLDFCRREARKILVGKTGFQASCKQSDVNELLVSLARAGKHVVRLKGGDPGIFGRAQEEVAACRAAGIRVEIVPGITTAQAAASSLGASLTSRSVAQRLQFVTGHAQNGRLPEALNWQSLADPLASTAVYMPRRTLSELTERVIAAGLPQDTPALAIFNVSRPEEAAISGSIATLPGLVAAEPHDGPMLVLFGRAFEMQSTIEATAQPNSSARRKLAIIDTRSR
jgi:uroporphyrin-III C-methyltransferase/precorrin-2 dehydrogenase/sirohydrochlorin ferrochelatase